MTTVANSDYIVWNNSGKLAINDCAGKRKTLHEEKSGTVPLKPAVIPLRKVKRLKIILRCINEVEVTGFLLRIVALILIRS